MIAKSDDMVVTHKMKWGNTDLISTQCLVHNAVAAYLHHIILYVNTGQMFWLIKNQARHPQCKFPTVICHIGNFMDNFPSAVLL